MKRVFILTMLVLLLKDLSLAEEKAYQLAPDKKHIIVSQTVQQPVELDAAAVKKEIEGIELWLKTIDSEVAKVKVERTKQLGIWKDALKEIGG